MIQAKCFFCGKFYKKKKEDTKCKICVEELNSIMLSVNKAHVIQGLPIYKDYNEFR